MDPDKRQEIKGDIMAEGVPVSAPPSEVKIGPVGNKAQQEPVVTTTSILGLVTGIVSYFVAKGWFDAADEAFLIGLAPLVAGILAGLIARRFAVPTAKADRAVEVAWESNPATDAKPAL
jgi:hypothetical protein